MTDKRTFLTNLAIQIGAFFAMLTGGAPIVLVTSYINMHVLHYNPILPMDGSFERQPISVFPLIIKILILGLCFAFIVFLVLRGAKTRKAVFNELTKSNLYNFMLYTFLQGMFFAVFAGLLGYTFFSTLFPSFYSGALP